METCTFDVSDDSTYAIATGSYPKKVIEAVNNLKKTTVSQGFTPWKAAGGLEIRTEIGKTLFYQAFEREVLTTK